jgi:hypothetical protein
VRNCYIFNAAASSTPGRASGSAAPRASQPGSEPGTGRLCCCVFAHRNRGHIADHATQLIFPGDLRLFQRRICSERQQNETTSTRERERDSDVRHRFYRYNTTTEARTVPHVYRRSRVTRPTRPDQTRFGSVRRLLACHAPASARKSAFPVSSIVCNALADAGMCGVPASPVMLPCQKSSPSPAENAPSPQLSLSGYVCPEPVLVN